MSFRVSERVPTHTQLAEFISRILPFHAQDVPLLYHVPRWTRYDPNHILVRDVVLSITPTPGVYEKLGQLAKGRQRAVCFLHRPFQLDRRALPRGSLILANHKRFDELLTTGYNMALASRLGMAIERAFCIQGYKGDPDRRIGIVGVLVGDHTVNTLRSIIETEMGVADIYQNTESSSRAIRAVAIMNAFTPDEVARVVATAVEAGIVQSDDASGLLYLTGQPRQLGLQAAASVKMPVVCVGHRPCEEWGIRFLGHQLRQTWPDLAVHLIFEDEVPPPRKTGPVRVVTNTTVIQNINGSVQVAESSAMTDS